MENKCLPVKDLRPYITNDMLLSKEQVDSILSFVFDDAVTILDMKQERDMFKDADHMKQLQVLANDSLNQLYNIAIHNWLDIPDPKLRKSPGLILVSKVSSFHGKQESEWNIRSVDIFLADIDSSEEENGIRKFVIVEKDELQERNLANIIFVNMRS